MNLLVIVLLFAILFLLLHINSKIPPRDYVDEALKRDKKRRGE